MQCVCLARGERYEATAHDETHVVVLSLIHRIEFCEIGRASCRERV